MKRKKVKPSHGKPGPIRHASLSDALLKRVVDFKQVLGAADADTLEGTIEDFGRDTDPEQEIQIWERIAQIYRSFVAENSITELALKQEVFSVVLGVSMGMKVKDFAGNVKLLTKEQIQSILQRWKSPFAQDVLY